VVQPRADPGLGPADPFMIPLPEDLRRTQPSPRTPAYLVRRPGRAVERIGPSCELSGPVLPVRRVRSHTVPVGPRDGAPAGRRTAPVPPDRRRRDVPLARHQGPLHRARGPPARLPRLLLRLRLSGSCACPQRGIPRAHEADRRRPGSALELRPAASPPAACRGRRTVSSPRGRPLGAGRGSRRRGAYECHHENMPPKDWKDGDLLGPSSPESAAGPGILA
jgi:hypothetical protein